MEKMEFCIGGSCSIIERTENGQEKFYLEIIASTADIDLEADVISADALRGAQHDLLKNNTVLDGHDRKKIAGSTVDSGFLPPRELRLLLLISNTRPDLQQQIRENALNKASIGGRILNFIDTTDPDTGQKIREITRIRFHEVSLVSLPANQEARSQRWWIVRGEGVMTFVFQADQHEGGDTQKMEQKQEQNGSEPAIVPGSPDPAGEVVAGFVFDESQIEAAGKQAQAEAAAMMIREKMLHVTRQLATHSEEGVVKAAEVLERLIAELPIASKSQGSGATDARFDKLEGLMERLLTPGTQPAPLAQAPQALGTQGGRGNTRVIVRHAPRPGVEAGAPAVGGDVVQTGDAAIKAELAECTTFSQKLQVLKKHRRFSIPVEVTAGQ